MSAVEDGLNYFPNPGAGPGVIMPSGTFQPVMNLAEQRHLEDRASRYNEHNALVNISDLAELDRLLVLELVVYRLGIWIGTGRDYADDDGDSAKWQRQVNELSTEIRLSKKNMGLDRPARERAKGEGSVASYWAQLQVRARAFGIHRVNQLDKGLELANELISLVQVHDNCVDDEEREQLHCTQSEIMTWVRERFIPEFTAVDEFFRATAQTYWIRNQ